MKRPASLHDAVNGAGNSAPLHGLLAELRSGLRRYWRVAHEILGENGVVLKEPGEESYSYAKNFFSLLFLYSFYRADIPPRRRVFYAAMLQCLRGMVTGCDNLLDDEYKMTLDTDIPAAGRRFRSVVDIMVSDRVLFQLLLEAYHQGEIAYDSIHRASTASMQSMMRSGVQEASEESGISEILPPETVLSTIHHLKTGVLFTCPWDIPLVIEAIDKSAIKDLTDALYSIGIGCQILDDMVDFFADIGNRRHNYLVSLVHHGESRTERKQLEEIMSLKEPAFLAAEIRVRIPEATACAAAAAKDYLESGLGRLFAAEHAFLVPPAIAFLQQRIAAPLSLNLL